MLEKEAKTKWCPFARVVEMDENGDPLEGFPVGNRSTMHSAHPHAKCIGSACMAWQWMSRADYEAKDGQGYCGLIDS